MNTRFRISPLTGQNPFLRRSLRHDSPKLMLRRHYQSLRDQSWRRLSEGICARQWSPQQSEDFALLPFVRAANPDEMSAVERAISEASVLRFIPDVASGLEFDEGGEFLDTEENIGRLAVLVEVLGLKNTLTKEGRISDSSHEKIRNALLAYLLGADTAQGRKSGMGAMLTTLTEEAAMHGLVNFKKALIKAAPQLTKLDGKSDVLTRFFAPLVRQYVAWKTGGEERNVLGRSRTG